MVNSFHIVHLSFTVTSPVKHNENKNASFALRHQAMNGTVGKMHSIETERPLYFNKAMKQAGYFKSNQTVSHGYMSLLMEAKHNAVKKIIITLF